MASLMMSAVAEEAEGRGDEERWGSGLGGGMTDDRRIYGCRRLMADGEKYLEMSLLMPRALGLRRRPNNPMTLIVLHPILLIVLYY